MQAAKKPSFQQSKSVPRIKGKRPVKKATPTKRVPSEQMMQAAYASISQEETFQMINDIDVRLSSSNGLFDEDAHNAKR